MNTFVRRCFAVIAASLLFVGCPNSDRYLDSTPENARLSPRKAIQIAKKAAERQGMDLSKYKEPEANYRSTGAKRWGVFFDGKVRTPGNHFYIFVDDQTGDTRYVEGN
jgi:hypothetical protein